MRIRRGELPDRSGGHGGERGRPGAEFEEIRLCGDWRRSEEATGELAVIREDHQSRPRPCTNCQDLFQHYASRYCRGGATLGSGNMMAVRECWIARHPARVAASARSWP